jgi:parallel beta-helix repeat protein
MRVRDAVRGERGPGVRGSGRPGPGGFRAVAYMLGVFLMLSLSPSGLGQESDYSSGPDEEQLPKAMRSKMSVLPSVTVGLMDAEIIGADNRALQAAVDYIAGLGGGTVKIGPGTYLMRDSLHLRSHVIVRGEPGRTFLRKADAIVSELVVHGDGGEEQVTLAASKGFEPGVGVTIGDRSNWWGFVSTVARITGKRGRTISLDRPLTSSAPVETGRATTIFPVVSGCNLEGARVENLTIDGNRQKNEITMPGCVGGGIYLFRGFAVVIQGCTVRNYNGDGISFQQSNDVQVIDCVVENNALQGLHPGSGSQRPRIAGCVSRGNGWHGLFLCWRVRHGRFEDNVLENNGHPGISIGHRDSDNLFRRNTIRGNTPNGILFREETPGNAGHRNRFEDNRIEDNGREAGAAAVHIQGAPTGLVFKKNTIRDTRAPAERTQTVGFLIDGKVGEVTMDENRIEAVKEVDDRRAR